MSLHNKNVFVAYFDILGFSSLIENNLHENTLKIHQNFFAGGIQICIAKHAESRLMNKVFWNEFPNTAGQSNARPKLENAVINSALMSDSVCLWTKGDTMIDFVDLVTIAQNIMIHSITCGIPLRGAISHGNIDVSGGQLAAASQMIQYSVIGTAVIKAVTLEKSQRWAGCVIDDDAILKFENDFKKIENSTLNSNLFCDLSYLVNSKILSHYSAPRKKSSDKMYVINWLNRVPTPFTEAEVRKSFEMHNKTLSHEINYIVDNTVRFMHDMYSSN